MKVLIAGANGQLGRALLGNVPSGIEPAGYTRSDLDISDSTSLQRVLDDVRPAVVINAAAYTAVDLAESQTEQAQAANNHAVASLAAACNSRNIQLIHVSTDFVFDGARGRPYKPDDPPNPLGVYGASKLAGERAIAAERGLHWCVIRTAWVYGAQGRNFMLTMLRLFQDRSAVRVVADQIGTPTSVNSLVTCLWAAVGKDTAAGLMHFTDAGAASWYDFAVAIYEEAVELGLVNRDVTIEPITTEQYPTAARRPSYSVLDCRGTYQALGLKPCHWRQRLREVLRELR